MRILVYRYGLLAPTENADLVQKEMRQAHDYRNTLVEIERGRRAARRLADKEVAIVSELQLAAEEADKVVEAALKAVKASKSKGRTRTVPEDLRDALNGARVKKRDALAALRQARKDAKEDDKRQVLVDDIEEKAKELRTNARAHVAPYWGTYLLIEDADNAARKAPLYDGAEPNDPRFVHWNGEGAIGVQLQKGAETAEIFDIIDPAGPVENGRYLAKVISRTSDLRMRVEHCPHRSGKEKEGRRFGRLWMRIGSDEQRKPIWAVFPMIIHREPPPGARIKRAIVTKRRIGPRDEWSVQITLEVPEASKQAQGGVVALDLGWRALEDGSIRVGRWKDDKGQAGEIALDARTVSGLRYPEHLRSIRDKAFEEIKAKFAAAMRGHIFTSVAGAESGSDSGGAEGAGRGDASGVVAGGLASPLPDWLVQGTATLDQWRSEARLAALVQKWKKNRFDGDEALFDLVEKWRYHDHHLWQWECDQRMGSLRHRKECYRIAASKLSKQYDVLLLEGDDKGKPMDLAAMRKKPSAEEKEEGERSNATMAAPGELRMVLVNAFSGHIVSAPHAAAGGARSPEPDSAPARASRGSAGAGSGSGTPTASGGAKGAESGAHEVRPRVVYVPMKNTTKECQACGSIEEWDQAKELHHTCSKCGLRWDQDDNAAQNLLTRYFNAPPPEVAAEPKTAAGGRWKKAKVMKADKDARKAADAKVADEANAAE